MSLTKQNKNLSFADLSLFFLSPENKTLGHNAEWRVPTHTTLGHNAEWRVPSHNTLGHIAE